MESIWLHEKRLRDYKLVKLINRYNYLFKIFKESFWSILKNKFDIKNDDIIMDIERGIVSGDKKMFWDYLWATHGIIQTLPAIPEWVDLKNAYHCVKFKFSSWKSIIIATNVLSTKAPSDILCLDDYYSSFDDSLRREFDRIFFEINKIEAEHFHSQLYKGKLGFIKHMAKDELCKILKLN